MSDVDLVIVGSGSGALTAANRAAERGASVLVLEKSDRIGGGSAMSTGLVFAPGNKWMRGLGIDDSEADGIRYLSELNQGVLGDDRIRAYVERTNQMVDWVAEHTPVELTPVKGLPDFHPELVGGRSGGRHLVAKPFEASALGRWSQFVRSAPEPMLSYDEVDELGGPAMTRLVDRDLIAARLASDIRTQGAGLVAGLAAGAISRNVEFITGARVTGLRTDGESRVTGVNYERGGATHAVSADSTLIASGGFEWNSEMNQTNLRGHLTGPLTPPSNEGDGHRMASSLGARLALMHESVWVPVLRLPDDMYDGSPRVRNLAPDKGRPHSIIVNQFGDRFVNESLNYYDFVHAMLGVGSVGFRNTPAYLIFDSTYRNLYPIGPSPAGGPSESWIIEAPSIAALAREAGIPALRLEATVRGFNSMTASGVDDEFGRGLGDFDTYYGDRSEGKNPALGAIDNAPFYLVPLEVGSFGNRGGLVGTDSGQVIHANGSPIEGLYACGNSLAQLVNGLGYEGGATIAQSMTFGFAAATAMTSRRD